MLKSLILHEGYEMKDVHGVAISNVVPALGPVLVDLCRRHLHCEPFFITADVALGIRIETDHPAHLGADLIVAADEAFARFGGPLIVIDAGTATTISAISAEGAFLGATIGPGLAASAEAIYQRAPHLPRIVFEAPPRPWGTNTVHAMQAGLLLGHSAMLDGLVHRIKAELGPARVVATGGLAETVVRECRTIDEVVPEMMLAGIRRIYLRNRRIGDDFRSSPPDR
jgi:type III pantothenate kinase